VLAVAKWLLHYMMHHDYHVAVSMLPSYFYSIRPKARDMVSLAFRFEPAVLPREDDTGLTQARPQNTAAATEIEMAQLFINEVAAIKDLDDKLEADKELKQRMFKKCASLLASLRYDMKAYHDFALKD
jgi:hypothetical protein